jgi:hypothetical protein
MVRKIKEGLAGVAEIASPFACMATGLLTYYHTFVNGDWKTGGLWAIACLLMLYASIRFDNGKTE